MRSKITKDVVITRREAINIYPHFGELGFRFQVSGVRNNADQKRRTFSYNKIAALICNKNERI